MKKLTLSFLLCTLLPLFLTTAKAQTYCPPNIGFENGNLANWECNVGNVSQGTVQINPTILNFPLIPTGISPIQHYLVSGGLDPYSGIPMVCPLIPNNLSSIRLGDDNISMVAAQLKYKLTIPANNNDYDLIFYYALVLQDGSHTVDGQSSFRVKIIDSITNSIIPSCSNFSISAINSTQFLLGTFFGNSSTMCTSWLASKINIKGFAGKTIYLNFESGDCAYGGHFGYAYLDFPNNCNGTLIQSYNCSQINGPTIFSAPVGFYSYNWYDSGFVNLVASSQNFTLPNIPNSNSQLNCIIQPLNNWGCNDTLTASYQSNAQVQSGCFFSATYCTNSKIHFLDNSFSNLPGALINHWYWNFGDPNSTTNNPNIDTIKNPTHYYSSLGTYTLTLISNYNNCLFDTTMQLININKNQIQSTIYASKDSVCGLSDTVTFYPSVVNSSFSYNWEIDSSTILVSGSLSSSNSIIVKFIKGGNHIVNLIASPPMFDTLCPTFGSRSIFVKGVAPSIALVGVDSICSNNSTKLILLSLPSNSGPAVNNCSSQSTFLTIGNNIQSSGGFLPTIFNGLYTESRTQLIYTKAELNKVGFYGGIISELTWNVLYKSSTKPYQNYTIKLASVLYNTLPLGKFDTSSSKIIVYSTANYNSTIGLNTFILNQAFQWDGVSNLLIEICYDNGTSNFSNSDFVAQSLMPTQGYCNFSQSDNNLLNACDNSYPKNGYISTISNRPDLIIKGCNSTTNLSNYSINWNSNPIGFNSNNDTVSISQTVNTIYTVTISSNNCISTINHPIKISTIYHDTLIKNICGFPFIFHGKTYLGGGDFHDTTMHAFGCDTITYLKLRHFNFNINKFETICPKDSFLFYNTYLKNAGTYSHTISSANNCDTIIVLNLNVTYNYSYIQKTICHGLSLIYNNKTYRNPGNYTDTIISLNGCDTIVTINLNMYYENKILNASICQGLSYNFGGKILTTTGYYYDTINGINTCDTIIQLALNFNQYVYLYKYDTICSSHNLTFNNKPIKVAGIYVDTLNSVSSCDTIIFLNVYKKNIPIKFINANSCHGINYNFNSKMLTTNGTYYDTIQTTLGCDTIEQLNLNFYYNTKSMNASICNGSFYQFNGKALFISGLYYDTISTPLSCDTILTLNLSVNNSYFNTQHVSICKGSSYYFKNMNLSLGGIYIDSFKSKLGCDSLNILYLNVDSVDNGITQNGIALESDETSSLANYQWIDCINLNAPIPNATNKNFIPSTTGIYAVIVSKGNCIDTSDCIYYYQNCIAHFNTNYDTLNNTFIVTVDSITSQQAISYLWNFGDGSTSTSATPTHMYTIDTTYNLCLQISTEFGDICSYCHIVGKDYQGHIIKNAGFTINIKNPLLNGIGNTLMDDNHFSIYPNPVSNQLTVSSNQFLVNTIEVTDVLGRLVNSKSKIENQKELQIDVSALVSGVYFIKATDIKGTRINGKFVKE